MLVLQSVLHNFHIFKFQLLVVGLYFIIQHRCNLRVLYQFLLSLNPRSHFIKFRIKVIRIEMLVLCNQLLCPKKPRSLELIRGNPLHDAIVNDAWKDDFLPVTSRRGFPYVIYIELFQGIVYFWISKALS